ncbi:MAG: primosomal protein N' [Firmicutes bacterium]|nr:primosomal protein N' [Bacillota bacterium]
MYAGVIVDIKTSSLDRIFHYKIPAQLESKLQIGHRVLVPFGNRKVEGYIIEMTAEPTYEKSKCRDILKLLDPKPVLSEQTINLAKWMADHYLGLYAEALQLFLPPGTRYGRERVDVKTQMVYQLNDLDSIEEYLSQLSKNATRQRDVLLLLKEINGNLSATEIIQKTNSSYATLRALENKGWILKKEERVERVPEIVVFKEKPVLALTNDQENALKVIKEELNGAKRPILLDGVTGSGKTEIYLRAIADVIKQNKQAIVLVPEIALTSQIVGRFVDRFGDQVAILHSGLSEGERFDQWWKIYRGEVKIVIGARSAVFAPVQNLGLIVLDEEHETTYKQDEGSLRYHARGVALKRAKMNEALVILGSATPSLESLHKALSGEYALVQLPKRVNQRPLPSISIVDMRKEFDSGNRTMFSRELTESFQEVLENGEQAIIFLNRRGFSTFLLCRECGNVIECDNCQVSMTYHQTDNRLHCHYCSATSPVPTKCPECRSPYIRQFGTGTQQVEDYIKKTFPLASTIRMDTDSTSRKGAHQRILSLFRKKERNVLIGTQMIAKGLDFPEVTLVGVLSADLSLNFPDFRASERTFQLLSQVSGRAGRGSKPGKVIIQCYDPSHYAIRAVQKYDNKGFYQRELAFRRELQYPPYGQLIRILVTGEEKAVKDYCQQVFETIKGRLGEERIFGPVPAPLAKIKGRHRWHLILKSQLSINHHLRNLPPAPKQVNVVIDIEPHNLL